MQSISAAVHIQGPSIRYAEVERDGSGVELRRLESETFEVDLTRVLWGEESPEALDEIAATVERLLDDSEASAVGLVVHPLDVFSFFMPLPDGLSGEERDRRVAYQAALVTNTRSPGVLHTVSQSVRTAAEGDETVEWVHVLSVPQEVEARMKTLFADVSGVETTGRIVSSEAVARLMGLSEGNGETDPSVDGGEGYRLAIGHYNEHTEYALTRDGAWHHAHAAQNAPTASDQAYYAVGMFNRIGVAPADLGHLEVYGSEADAVAPEPFEEVFGCAPVALDPFGRLRRVREEFDESGSAGEWVPCIGGAVAVSVE